MSRGSNVGRTVFGVAAAAGVAGLLNYTPPPTELRAAATAPEQSLPVVAGPFTATPASVPLPVQVTAPTTTTTLPPPAPTTTVAPPVTEAPPAAPAPAPEAEWTPAPAPVAWYPPARVYYPPEPEPVEEEAAPADDSGDKCDHFDDLLSVLDDSELRAAVATVGC